MDWTDGLMDGWMEWSTHELLEEGRNGGLNEKFEKKRRQMINP